MKGEKMQEGDRNRTEGEKRSMDNASMELPKYQCHKIVHAAKITEIQKYENDGVESRTMVFGDIGGKRFLTNVWRERFQPEVGGYYVVYDDGYTSYSPAGPFEAGYTKL